MPCSAKYYRRSQSFNIPGVGFVSQLDFFEKQDDALPKERALLIRVDEIFPTTQLGVCHQHRSFRENSNFENHFVTWSDVYCKPRYVIGRGELMELRNDDGVQISAVLVAESDNDKRATIWHPVIGCSVGRVTRDLWQN